MCVRAHNCLFRSPSVWLYAALGRPESKTAPSLIVAELTEEREREQQLQERRKQVGASIQQLRKMKEQLETRIR